MQDKKREQLQKAFARVIKRHRKYSISKICNEIELSKSVWSMVEQEEKDVQLSTMWRIAEALGMPASQLIKYTEEELGKDFYFAYNPHHINKE